MNLIEGLQQQMNRNRVLLKQYEAIGIAGVFGAQHIIQGIKNAESAIETGDVIKMLQCYESLKTNN